MRKSFFILISICLFTFQLKAQNKKSEGLDLKTKAPLFQAINQDGDTISLKSLLERGPVVLLFYRGQWCPVCSRHLSNIQDSLSYIKEKGATVVAVSPEKQELLQKTKKKTGAQFTLLYDDAYKIMDAYDVVFYSDKAALNVYNMRLDANLKNAHSDDSQRLPVPATYVIKQDGTISYKQFDVNYKNRATVKEILKSL